MFESILNKIEQAHSNNVLKNKAMHFILFPLIVISGKNLKPEVQKMG
jgi:hypothetical protein